MKRKIILFFAILLATCFTSKQLSAQTSILQHDIDWSTHHQNMWGPNGSPFSINMNINLFSVGFDTTMSFGSITNFLGGQFGAMIDVDTWFQIGSDFSINGFTTGSVDVDYPVSVFLEIPNDNTFCPGDSVTIRSWYEVRPGWNLETHFPTAGVIALTLDFGFDLDVDATICVFSCTTIPIIDVHIPYDTITIIGLNSQTGVFTYPCYIPTNFPPFGICTDTILPITFNNLWGIGLSGSITLPYVITTDYLDATSDPCHKNLYANGDSTWVELELDIVQFLSAIAGLIPPPQGPAIQQFLQNLSGTIDMGMGFYIYYNLFSAWLNIESTMKQNFTFEPTIWNHLAFPHPVDYFITDPQTGTTVGNGFGNNIDFMACHNLTYQWPCADVSSMNIGIGHSLDNNFTNHTWDSLAFSFTIQALHFIIQLPIFLTSAPADIPALCIPIVTDSTGAVIEQVCIPEVTMPQMSPLHPDITIVIGPLIDITWPLGYIPITWFNQTWELAGFNDTIFPPFTMSTNCPQFQTIGSSVIDVLCFGESTGTATVNVQNGKPNYSYEWSDGFFEITPATSSTNVGLSSGIYYITITDANGCVVFDTVTIIDAYPPLTIAYEAVDITCVGGSDGAITLNVSGGLPPYQYTWDPNISNTHFVGGVPAGTYSITVTDANDCDTSVSITLIELYPLPPVNFHGEPVDGCQPLYVQFFETSPEEGQTYLWNFGTSAGFSTLKEPLYLYTGHGLYDVSLIVTSIHGCENSLTLYDYIEVYPKPVAQFLPNPRYPDMINPSVYFYNQSTFTAYADWSFGDGYYSSLISPYHTYGDTGTYHVVLMVESEHGCRDTTSMHIRVKDFYAFYVPNAFSPDGDGINEIFKPVGHNISEDGYNLMVFNRWGVLVFQTTDKHEGWDGTTLSGVPCWADTYVWQVTYVDFEGIIHQERGVVQLVK